MIFIKMKYIFSALLLCCTAAIGQVKIKGRVTDLQTGIPLTNATIISHKSKAITDETGLFRIGIFPLNDTLTVSFSGYEIQHIPVQENNGFFRVTLSIKAISLSTVTVTGYENNRKLMETAGSIAVLTKQELLRGDGMDMMPAMNTIPGVKMEAFTPGDYRLSIRGSLLRSPWGLRNVKMYWNDIPLTSPDNSASRGVLMDPLQTGSIEVIKGPAGSIYGAGNGGVILFKSDKARYHENSASAGLTVGSFGYSRLNTTYKVATDNLNITGAYNRQHYDGYRENGWSNKGDANMFARFYASPKRTLSFFATHSEGSIGIAGSVDSAWAAQMPRKAIPFCKDYRVSVQKYSFTMFGASQEYRFNNVFSNTTSLYGSAQTLDHPYGQNEFYKLFLKQSANGYGGRTRFKYSPEWGSIKPHFTFGGEYQQEQLMSNTFDLINDIPGTKPETGELQVSHIILTRSGIIFAQAEFDLPSGFIATLGGSYNRLSYDVNDLIPASVSHTNYTGKAPFESFSPRLALVKTLQDNMAVHGSISSGFSPPTSGEARNSDGSFNKDLDPEKGMNYELGFRGSFLDKKLDVDASVYQMNLNNAILSRINQYGTESYVNAGSTRQRGIELSLFYNFLANETGSFTLLKPWLNYSFCHYRFKDYTIEVFDWNTNTTQSHDYSGNKLTGIPSNSINAGIDFEARPGIYGNAVLNFIDRTPINDANTHNQHAYTLLAAKIGYTHTFGTLIADFCAGANNLLNASYSSLISLNADAGAIGGAPKFFNPSPSRNFYCGLTLKYNFKNEKHH